MEADWFCEPDMTLDSQYPAPPCMFQYMFGGKLHSMRVDAEQMVLDAYAKLLDEDWEGLKQAACRLFVNFSKHPPLWMESTLMGCLTSIQTWDLEAFEFFRSPATDFRDTLPEVRLLHIMCAGVDQITEIDRLSKADESAEASEGEKSAQASQHEETSLSEPPLLARALAEQLLENRLIRKRIDKAKQGLSVMCVGFVVEGPW